MNTAKRFAIARLTLSHFRNYDTLRLTLPVSLSGPVVLVGANGAGKTNLLEAISMLAPGRGLRGEAFSALSQLGSGGQWAVAADAITPTGDVQLGTAWKAGDMAEGSDSEVNAGRSSMVDGVPHRTAGPLAGHLRLLWLTPAMDRLFAGSPGERRRFFDRLASLFDPDQQSRVNRFERLVRERNKVLESQEADRIWLDSLETQMAELAVAIAMSRVSALDRIRPAFARGNGPFPGGRITALGELELLSQHQPAVKTEEDYKRALRDGRGLDKAAGKCLRGPHRSDFEVVHGPKDMPAEACSTGEQKALLLGLILAQAEAAKPFLGAAPLLLLDEVTAHLDQARRQALFRVLEALGGQAWMSGTDRLLFDGIGPEAVVYKVENGHISESNSTA